MKKTFLGAATALALMPMQMSHAQVPDTTDAAVEASASADGASVAEQATESASAATDSVGQTATGQNDAAAPLSSATGDTNVTGNATAVGDAIPEASATTDASANPQRVGDAEANVQVEAEAQAGQRRNGRGQQAGANNVHAGLQFGPATQQGITLNRVANDSILYRSGLRNGDVLVSYGGRPIRNQNDFQRSAVYQPGQRVPVVVWREGREETIYVIYDRAGTNQPQRQAGYAPSTGGAYLGVTFDPQAQQGAVVRSVEPGSPAENAGIAPGQLIVAINDQQVNNYQDVIDYMASFQPGQEVDLIVAHRVLLSGRQGNASYSNPPNAPAAESSVIRQAPGAPPVALVPANRPDEGTDVVRPGDADRDGRVLDGDGRAGRRRAGRQ